MLSPLKDLYQDKSSMPVLSYPSDLGSSKKGHYIAFTISSQEKSRFSGNVEQNVATPISSAATSLTSSIQSAETALNNVASAVGTVTDTIGGVANALNSTLSTFNTVVGGAASVVGAVSGVGQTLSSSIASGSITGGIQAGVTALGVAGNVLGSASSLASSADAVVGSVGNFLSDPMGAISDAYDSVKNALGNPDKLLAEAFSGAKNNPIFAPQTLKPVGYINLYTPDTINLNQQASWQSLSKTEAFGAAGKGQEAIGRIGGYVDAMREGGLGAVVTKAMSDPMGGELAGQAASEMGFVGGQAANYLLAKGGYAVNPQLEVIFDQMQFRTFQFTFTFTPKNAKEAKTIRDIIYQFRFHAAPENDTTGAGRYFIAPSIFNIEYMFSDAVSGKHGPNTNLHKFAPCVLTSIFVDYASDVGWVTHDDGMPVKTQMVLQFQEVEIMTKERIEQGY